MLELLERQKTLTLNQWKIISAAIIGDMLDFFDFFLIGYALAFIVGAWKLTFLESGTILLAAGVGAILCVLLGLDGRPHWSPQGLYRDRAQFFPCHRHHGADPRPVRVDFPLRLPLRCRHRGGRNDRG